MRQLCGRCEGPLRLVGAYAAEESMEDVEISVWACPDCDVRLEIPEPAPAWVA